MKILLAVLFGLALAASEEVKFNGNITIKGDADFAYRSTTLQNLGIGALYTSTEVNANAHIDTENSEAEATANADFLLGYALSGSLTAGLAYFNTEVAFNINAISFDGAAGAAAINYGKIVEVSPDGNEVESFAITVGTWSDVEVSDAEAGLRYMKATGYLKQLSNNFKSFGSVEVTLISSNVAGRIEYAKAEVGPKTMEMIVKISGYTLAAPENHLRLVLKVATTDAHASGSALVSTKSDMYATLSRTCFVNGKEKKAKVSTMVKIEDGNEVISGSIFGELELQTYTLNVDFPAGATEITYDPALGHGTLIYGASAGLFPSLMLIVAVLAMLLF